jgi:hypothetical protein
VIGVRDGRGWIEPDPGDQVTAAQRSIGLHATAEPSNEKTQRHLRIRAPGWRTETARKRQLLRSRQASESGPGHRWPARQRRAASFGRSEGSAGPPDREAPRRTSQRQRAEGPGPAAATTPRRSSDGAKPRPAPKTTGPNRIGTGGRRAAAHRRRSTPIGSRRERRTAACPGDRNQIRASDEAT